MAGTSEGAMRKRARDLGMTPAEYASHVLAGEKWCYRCASWKPLRAFNRDRSRSDGRDSLCAGCREVPDRDGPSRRERRERMAAGEAWCRECRAWGSDVRAGLCRAHQAADQRARYAADQDFRFRRRDRVKRRRRGVGAVPPDGVEMLADLHGEACIYCGGAADGYDHLIAVALGGRTTPGNMVPACTSCNSSKKDRDLDEWLDSMAERGMPISDRLVDALGFMDSSLYG